MCPDEQQWRDERRSRGSSTRRDVGAFSFDLWAEECAGAWKEIKVKGEVAERRPNPGCWDRRWSTKDGWIMICKRARQGFKPGCMAVLCRKNSYPVVEEVSIDLVDKRLESLGR